MKAVVVSMVLIVLAVCVLIYFATTNTTVREHVEKVEKDEPVELPSIYFIFVSWWTVLSGSWIAWNEEARVFLLRRYWRRERVQVKRKISNRNKINPSPLSHVSRLYPSDI